MARQELDDILRKKFKEERLMPSDDIWNNIDASLSSISPAEPTVASTKSPKPWLKMSIGVAAALLLLFFAIHSNQTLNKNSNSTANNHIAHNNVNANDPIINNDNDANADAKSNNITVSPQITYGIPVVNKNAVPSTSTIEAPTHTIPSRVDNSHMVEEDYNTIQEVIKSEVVTNSSEQSIETIKHSSDSTNEIYLSQQYEKVGLKYINDEDRKSYNNPYTSSIINNNTPSSVVVNNNHNKTQFAIIGGFNTGNISDGYNVAVNAKKDINDKFFIDGSIGMVMNASTPNQKNFKGDYLLHKKQPQLFSNRINNLFDVTENLYYVQINPSIGFNVYKSIDIAIGPDYQQMVSNITHDVVDFSTINTQLLPKSDFGVSSKVEMGLFKNMKAGIMVREGVNKLINNNASYGNRRYFQIQLKYNLPF